MSFTIESLELPEVRVVTPRVHADERGAFFESWHAEKLSAVGFDATFSQDNHSISSAGVLRGLHYQIPPARRANWCGSFGARCST